MPLWLHVSLCVVVPAVWGVAMVGLFNVVDRRRRRALPPQDGPPPIDYVI